MSEQKRRCLYIPVGQFHPERGYIPSLVTEGEPGHAPMLGQGEFSQPWYWGTDYDKAVEMAKGANERLGLSAEDVSEIIASSIGQTIREDAAVTAKDDRLAKALGRRFLHSSNNE